METKRPDQVSATYLSPGEAAEALGVSRQTVARLADAGKIRSIRPGAHRRYVAADVAALIAQEPWEPAS